jgi:hypothetical protein
MMALGRIEDYMHTCTHFVPKYLSRLIFISTFIYLFKNIKI